MAGKTLHCGWCGSDDVEYLYTDYQTFESDDGGWQVYQCQDCHMKFDLEPDTEGTPDEGHVIEHGKRGVRPCIDNDPPENWDVNRKYGDDF